MDAKATPISTSSAREASAPLSLVALCRRVGFGTIHGLRVAGGQPVLDPFPRVIAEVKFGAEFKPATPRPVEPLRNEDHQLLAALAAIGDGVVESIEVRHGVPFRMSRVLEGDAMSPPHPLDDPAMRDRIRGVAKRMRARLPRPLPELEEIEQQLTLGVLVRLPKFEPARGPLGAFVTAAAKSAAQTMVRDATRAKRDPKRVRQLSDESSCSVTAREESPDDRHDLRVRVRRAAARMSEPEADAARHLMRFGSDNARARLGLSRSQWVQIRQAIRLALEAENHGNSSPKPARRAGDGVSNE